MVDVVTIFEAGLKAHNDDKIKGPILSQKVVDVKVTIQEQREIWRKKGCTIITSVWTNRKK